ncbi:MFS transporter [Prolixibacteraceae bacterium JC049]|nr:MFS transporter [Prolixibacteraceae bacterium JC049]
MTNKNVSGNVKALPIFLAFLCMGFGDVVGPLVSLAKDTFSLSNTMAQLLPFMGFIMFAILSVPMGVYQDKKGKKFVLTVGLIIALVGLLVPIFNGMYGPKVAIESGSQYKFYVLLGSILLLGAGATILQVSGNPIMRDVSPEGKFSSNLSLGQSIKAVGSSLGFLLPPFVAKAFGMDWSILFPIYALLILVTLLWLRSTKIEEKKDPEATPATFMSCLGLLGNPYVLMMVMAIFVYVGAEVSMSSGVPILLKEHYGIEGVGLWLSWALFFLPILAGRLAGAAILRSVSAIKFLFITVIIAMVGIGFMYLGSQALTFAGIVLVGLGFANIFPLVFSIAIDKMPERSNEISGLMVMAIAGGAFIPPIWGAVADATSELVGFLVPLACLVYILFTAFANKKA